MNIIILKNEAEVAERGADIVSHQLATKPSSVLGLAAGVTPVKMYRSLVSRFQAGEVSFASAKTFMLDEYVGVDKSNPHSYSHFMHSRFFDLIDIKKSKTHSLCYSDTADHNYMGADYEERIQKSGGIDLQILGMGTKGDIGFNEAGSSFASRTRIVRLEQESLRRVPRVLRGLGLAATMGLKTIRDSQHILLMATGSHKAEAVRRALEGQMTTSCPASCLQFHNNVTVLLDEAAARELANRRSHEEQYQNRLELLSQFGSKTYGIKALYPSANLAH